MTQALFSHVPDPLAYAESFAGYLMQLVVDDASTLSALCVAAAAQLSRCELSELYRRDTVTGRLTLIARHLSGKPGLAERASVADFQHEQLLSYVVEQRCSLSVEELSDSPYQHGFLPAMSKPWRALTCIPLFNRDKLISGVLLCASQCPLRLDVYTASLGEWGGVVLRRLAEPRIAGKTKTGPLHSPIATGTYGLIGHCRAMDKTCRLIGKVINTSYTVLLRGETGTGKEVVARAIHAGGPRGTRAFVVQNCAAFPEGLLESELFGYRKGAFTGADKHYTGLFDTAHGGTLLLDEIGDMPLSLQAKLLRVLQEGEIRPLGASASHKVDVRIIAATHRDLAAMVAQGSFREDLYYRLAQFPIELPALREREGDVLLLARHFAEKACAALGKTPIDWSDDALDLLSSHDFPGNVRELKCLMERAVLLCDEGTILPQHLSLSRAPTDVVVDTTLRQRLERVERVFLIDCLHKNRGNRTRTARELGVARRTLLYRLARLNIPCGDARGEC
ncbi:sigma-54 interaction domain-containing protein [Pseudomonas sp. SDO524_S393]